ncbi:hypothetical protein NZD85_11385 [Empedobacter stercoris]|uniref:Uncharacterized protein n=2 Tax=Empedobacter TaxID=59734 RepID=A0ABY8V4S0_9FLAO|nr:MULTISPECIES: hypothetical protein [Empedobacter]MCA4776926.1 hypothetical protein [Empedobacter stercoris]MCA4782568.1 hypothetical protein [Empedobacter stercoris]MCA4810201.1 hypothetical protein [Empedobacter stercoris]MDM1522596.1 hypothetical protein [Empedobacter sp. 225-1]MDM1543370.1 hypothetical protein [Empedobacter sp. 189-2]
MKTIKFFHPDETFNYNIEKSLCKVVFQGNKKCLLVEIHSTDDLEHVEGDSLQNDFPQLSLFIDDFPLDVESVEELNGKKVSIPYGFAEEEDEEGEIVEVYYTSLNVSEEDFETVNNDLAFSVNEKGVLTLNWKGEVQDFTEESDGDIPFEINCSFEEFDFKEDDYE